MIEALRYSRYPGLKLFWGERFTAYDITRGGTCRGHAHPRKTSPPHLEQPRSSQGESSVPTVELTEFSKPTYLKV